MEQVDLILKINMELKDKPSCLSFLRGQVMYKLLVVEDDEDINKILKRYLENAGYQAFSAYSGSEAKLFKFNLVLLRTKYNLTGYSIT